ncbi:UNVERIFIED_CONTAM: hypothetical protein RMT77_011242 [Armadillidium vulgare]
MGREALTMETAENQNISFRREKGCFLSSFTIFLLFVFFIASVVASGVLVYFFAGRPQSDVIKGPPYELIEHAGGAGHQHEHDHHHDHAHHPTEPRAKSPIQDPAITDNINDQMIKTEQSKNEMETKKKKKVMDVRLPRNVNPLHYLVQLRPYINENFTFDGHVEMTFEVLEDTMNVTLHINDIVTKNETIKVMPENSQGDSGEVTIKSHQYDQDRQFYVAHLKEPLKRGQNYIISIDFVGFLNKDLDGFYRSSYKDENGNTRWLAATQFQPTDARKAFPCMDEPGLKASFTIELARLENMSSISNMPLKESLPMEGEQGWVWDKFEKSLKMSTYLVAFVISDFKYLESKDKTNYTFRVWAREGALPQADYAIKTGPPASKFFEEFFKVPFPLPKQDMIALPDFSAGAMENWGLITYRETAMLYDPRSSTSRDKLYLASVIVHELAHQWFGNLVTPEWWTDLWLNEGFASYMEYVGVDAVEPTWKMMELFVVNDLHSVFRLDCLESSHPINIPVGHPDEINEIFDRISYLKGSSIIRMMSNFLTENTFRDGLSKYLTGLAYKSAVQDDLWSYLTKQAHDDRTLERDLTVKAIMDTWTLQMGFPVLTVTNNNDGTATLMQERFLLVKNQTTNPNSHDYKWWIPITYTSQSNPDFTATSPKLWMRPSEAKKTVEIPRDGWVIFNNRETGYYRVNYDDRSWDLIINQLLTDHTVIDPINRAQIIDDTMTLARAGIVPYATAFKVLSYLRNENEYVPWKAALSGLSFIESMFEQTGGFGALKEFSISLILPMYKKLGFQDSVNDPFLEQLQRAQILQRACSLGHRPCIEESVKLYKSWMKDPDNYSIISPNLKNFVYCTAIAEGGYEEWKFAWNRYENSNVGVEKRLLLNAMGCSKKTWILNGYIDRSIQDGKGIRKQDVRSVIGAVSSSEIGRNIAWEFLKDKWDDVKKYFGSVSFTLGSIIKACTGSLNTQNQIQELEQFLKLNDGNFGSAQRAAEQAFENAQNNLNWMNKYYDKILDWLNKNNYGNNI